MMAAVLAPASPAGLRTRTGIGLDGARAREGARRRSAYAASATAAPLKVRPLEPVEIVTVVQSLIVLFIAAPPLVRAAFHLPQPGAKRKPRRKAAKEVAA